jgi:3-oxoacyl-(acyl-carrier-protein) synthase
MKRRVFISAVSFKAPGMNSVHDLKQALSCPEEWKPVFETMPLTNSGTAFFGQVTLEEHSPHFPRRSDQKVMRQDVKAAYVCAGEIIAQSLLSADALARIPLFIASGTCLEHQQEEYNLWEKTQVLAAESKTVAEKHHRYYQAIPPLLALRSLTNATESFVAQYSGVAGCNTTFGGTSHSGYYALQEGIGQIQSGYTDIAMVGASHAGGLYSYLTYASFTQPCQVWRDSVGAAFLLLESEESLRSRGLAPLAEIKDTAHCCQVPSLFGFSGREPYGQLPVPEPGCLAVFSGGLSEGDYEQEKDCVAARWSASRSLYPLIGHLGAVSMLMNLIAGIYYLQEEALEQVDCLDHDAYNRSSMVQIKQVAKA